MGGIQRQDPNLQRKTQHRPLRASRCSFMSTVPSMNLRIFPKYQSGPLPPLSDWNPSPASLPFGLTGSIIPVPDHSSPHVPLLHPWKTPPPADSKVWWASFSLSSKASKSFKMKPLNYFKQPLELSILLCILMRHGALLLCKCKFLHSFFSLAKVVLWLLSGDSNVHDIWNRAPENLNITKYALRISIQTRYNSVQFNRKGCLCVMIVYCFLRNYPILCFV